MSKSTMADNKRENDSPSEEMVDPNEGSGEGAEERVAQLEQENKQLREQMIRALADLENIRRRAQQERSETIEYANERLLREILPIIDDFRRSVDAGGQSKDFESFYQGVSMIDGKLQKLLESQKVKKMETVGSEFDVNLHDAMMRQPSDAPEGTVIGELEPGYMYGDKVLRHAKVIVSAGS